MPETNSVPRKSAEAPTRSSSTFIIRQIAPFADVHRSRLKHHPLLFLPLKNSCVVSDIANERLANHAWILPSPPTLHFFQECVCGERFSGVPLLIPPLENSCVVSDIANERLANHAGILAPSSSSQFHAFFVSDLAK